MNGTNYTAAGIQTALQGVSEVQNVALTGYTTDGNSYTLRYNGNDTVPITRGQNNTAAGIQAAIQGGSEQQAVTLGSFNGDDAVVPDPVRRQHLRRARLRRPGDLEREHRRRDDAAAAGRRHGRLGGRREHRLHGHVRRHAREHRRLFALDRQLQRLVHELGPRDREGHDRRGGLDPEHDGVDRDRGRHRLHGDVQRAQRREPARRHERDRRRLRLRLDDDAGTLGILPPGASATVAGFGGGTFNNTGFQVTFTGSLAATNVPVLLGVQDFTAGASGFTGETDKGGAVDNQGAPHPTGNTIPVASAPSSFTIPLQTPFALTGIGDRRRRRPAGLLLGAERPRRHRPGTALLNNNKIDGPLFAMFPQSRADQRRTTRCSTTRRARTT